MKLYINANRAGQVGTGDRSEKIRTYNFPQDRCTDHRIGLTVHNLDKIMDGNLDETPVYLKHDGGYTYGGITWDDLEEGSEIE